ncbi:acetyltransferase [Actinocorallia populi]|uniref:acetyltransferase n=1 Tax=Actinocorallia populi TaxID=2079200 RepID=UPI000D096E3E|nr:acetyltransferase [Actinocorallia populi]
MKKALFSVFAAGTLAAAVAGTATPAVAATSPAAVCGSGYGIIDSQTLKGSVVYLLYSGSAGRNCVVTVKTTSVGTPTRTGTYLQVQNKSPLTDVDDYSYYAGPTRASAAGQCVKWGGGTNNQWWYSGFEHCG